ncbi:J domain-containing protein [Haloarchaeobius amylolyticus]|uniref:J domain-containing protein n=1 Tax=Haloarchaeobius amylolyticus TaxID=1198296 RepID=UPI002270F7C1|nr:J domain-containing protein [Haloarchaeobius amylolyticus]
MPETFYDVLGVAHDADQDAIRDAYRERVKETHPDLNDAPDAAEAFQRVAEAEEVLGDPDERARYDRLGHEAYVSSFGGPGGVGQQGRDRPADDPADDGPNDGYQSRNRRQEYPGSDRRSSRTGNETNRSYYVGDDEQEATADGGSTGSAAEWFVGEQSEQRRRTGTNTRREHVAEDDEDDEFEGFSVHDWDDEDIDADAGRVNISQNTMVIVVATFLMYPFMAYTTVAPVGLAVNLTVGACMLLLLVYLLTIPRVSVFGFAALSVVVPLGLAAVGVAWLSLHGLFVLGSVWIPFGYAMLFAKVLSSPS